MLPEFDRLRWLKSQTFWQVAFCLILLTVLQVISKTISANTGALSNSLMESSPSLKPIYPAD